MKQLVESGAATINVSKENEQERSEVDTADTTQVEFVLPFEGTVKPLGEVEDEVFSSKMMGDGFAIDPVSNTLVSPIEGEVMSIFPTKHAIGLKANNGLEILIHVGLDTVKLNGEGFKALVQEGQHITKETPLLEIDLEYVKKHAPSITTPIIFTNLSEGKEVKLNKSGYQKQGTPDVIKF
jgi:PTS system N-acetylglucosamine-specific IIC component